MTCRVLLWDIGAPRSEANEPIGIGMIASEVQRRRIPVAAECLWTLSGQHPDLESLRDYRVIGISARIGTYDLVLQIGKALAEIAPHCLLVIGNAIPTYAPDYLLPHLPNAICVVGEGESSFADLLTTMVSTPEHLRKCLRDVPNLVFRDGTEVVTTPRRSEDLASLAPPCRPYLNDLIARGGVVRIEASRGCAYSGCSFCCVKHRYGDGLWRPFPLAWVVEQLETIATSGGRAPYFTDEDFVGGEHSRVEELSQRIIDAKREGMLPQAMNFFASLSVRDVVAPLGNAMLSKMKEAGFREVYLGLESGVKSQLNRYRKPASPDSNRKALQLVAQNEMQVDTGFILFDPEMSFPDLRECMDYVGAMQLNRHDARSSKSLRLQPCTELARIYSSRGIVTGSLDPNSLTFPYRFSDCRVEAVHSRFRSFEAVHEARVYQLQALSRGEVPSEDARGRAKELLGDLRLRDYSYLRVLIEYCEGKINDAAESAGRERLLEEKEAILRTAGSIREGRSYQ